MSDEAKKSGYELEVNPDSPDKVTLVIDPISKPVEFVEDTVKVIGKAAKKAGKAIKGLFK